jgi:hypothetical protein
MDTDNFIIKTIINPASIFCKAYKLFGRLIVKFSEINLITVFYRHTEIVLNRNVWQLRLHLVFSLIYDE